MSDKTERPNPRDAVTVTPEPSRQDLFEWMESKFDGSSAFPKYFKLKLAFGTGLHAYRDDTLEEKEFKISMKKPDRPAIVGISNHFLSFAQNHCNECGKPTGFVILAINHEKSADAYGMFSLKLRPTTSRSMVGGSTDLAQHGIEDDQEVLSDGTHRDRLLRHQLDHVKQSDEHVRWMHDSSAKAIGGVLALQQDMIKDQREHIKFLEGQRLEAFKAIEEAQSKKEEREMARKAHEFKLDMFTHGFNVVKQLVPVMVKTLEGRKNGAPTAALPGAPITDSPESIAIKSLVESLSDPQKALLFGHREENGPHIPGILTVPQTQIIGSVAELVHPPSILDNLMEGPHAITPDQMSKVREAGIPMEVFMGLYMMLQERQKQKAEAYVAEHAVADNTPPSL